MVLHPEVARWIVLAKQERVNELVRRSRPRPLTARRRHRGRLDAETEGA